MKQLMYEKLVGMIHRHRTWIGVIDHDHTQTFKIRVNDELKSITCRVLVLYAREQRGVYYKGYSWNIPEYRLDRAVNALKSKSVQFRKRWENETIYPKDAEALLLHASRGYLNLNLKTEDELAREAGKL